MKEKLGLPIVRIEKFDPDLQLGQLSKLYQEVFAGPPWNEYTQCMSCSEFFGLNTNSRDICGNCGNELVLAYPEDKTKKYILKEIAKPESSSFIAKQGDEIVGFVWGYVYETPFDFVKEKYRTLEMQDKIRDLLTEEDIREKFFYFSECGVSENERGKGISNLLSNKLIQETKKMGLPLVMRTNWKSPMVAVAESFYMKQLIGPKAKVDRFRNVINLGGEIVNNFQDIEIEERVLFVLK